MGTTLTFDTLKFAETLKASGFDDSQTKGIVAVMREAQNAHLEELASKQNIKELDVKIENTRVALQKDIADSKAETIRWTAGMFAAQTAIIIGAMFAMVKINQPTPPPPAIIPQQATQEMQLSVPEQPPPPKK